MLRKILLFTGIIFGLAAFAGRPTQAQDDKPHIRVVVDLVQLNVAVTDSKGNYITGLHPEDFVVTEDGIKQKIASFAEGNEPSRRVGDAAMTESKPAEHATAEVKSSEAGPATDSMATLSALTAGANVFILFDTSNYMYRGFVFAQDAIADFVRSLDGADKIAFYSYSRDLLRASVLTADRGQILHAVRTTVAGDDAALYNTLLLTVKDAAQQTGRKVIVVFSNGPDNASMVPPEDVAELAQSAGIPIYMISTQQAKLEPVSTAVFERMTAATGGKAYFSKTWRDEKRAFAAIRDDLGHLYALTYYPQANPNRGWRAITVKLSGERAEKYHIRTRNGYRPLPNRFSGETVAEQAELPAPPNSASSTR